MVCRTALFCSFHRYEEGLGGLWENAISLMVIGLSYSEELNYSDESYRYPSTKKQPNRPPGSQFTVLVQMHRETWYALYV